MHNLRTFDFEEDEIQVVTDDRDGTNYVPITPMAENIGLNLGSQRTKVQNDPKFSSIDIRCTGKDGKKYKMLCIPEDEVGAWLFSINSNKIKDENIREKLLRYQKKLVTAIHDFTTKGYAINKEKISNTSLVDQAAQLVAIAEQSLANTKITLENAKQIEEVKRTQEVDTKRITELEDVVETNYSAIPGDRSVPTIEEFQKLDDNILRSKTGNLIRFVAKHEEREHRQVWSHSYANYNEERNTNLMLRASIRGCKILDVLEQDGLLKDFYELTYRFWKVFNYHNE